MKRLLFKILFGFIIFVSNIYGNSLDDVVIKNNKKAIEFLDDILKDKDYIQVFNTTNPDQRRKIPNFDYKENMMDTIIQELKSYGKILEFFGYIYLVPKNIMKYVLEEKRANEVERFRLFTFMELHHFYDCIVNSKKFVDGFLLNFVVYIKDLNTRYKLQ
ncbi:hypothetical protein [Borreliella bavariensis]|uniref:hypothetical protein n=1 Tax=Borreliella bavariensis TaxID=664662 RepID=UPI001C004F86|nr:hypothetical protein [Borreliella bavariensis]